MIDDRQPAVRSSSDPVRRVEALDAAIDRAREVNDFETGLSMIDVMPLGSESRKLMEALDVQLLRRFKFLNKVASMQTEDGTKQYLLSPKLTTEDVRELVDLLRSAGLQAEALLLELNDCIRRGDGVRTSHVLNDWRKTQPFTFGMHHFVGFLAGAQTCRLAVSHRDVGGWTFPSPGRLREFPDALHGIAQSVQRLDRLHQLLLDPEQANEARKILTLLAADAPEGKVAGWLRTHDWKCARESLSSRTRSIVKMLKDVGVAVVMKLEGGEWNIKFKHEGKSAPVEAMTLIAEHLGQACAKESSPSLTAACVQRMQSEDMHAGRAAFSDALAAYGAPPAKWWTPELLEVVVRWFRVQPAGPAHIEYLIELCQLACRDKVWDDDVLKAIRPLADEPLAGPRTFRTVLMRLAGANVLGKSTRRKALGLFLDLPPDPSDSRSTPAGLFRFAAANGLAEQFLRATVAKETSQAWLASVLTPGVYPYNIRPLGDRQAGSFLRLLEKERILMRADELLKGGTQIKIEWSNVLEDCCHLIRGVGFDRPVVELLGALFVLRADRRTAFEELEIAAQRCTNARLRMEAAAFIGAVWGDAGKQGLLHAMEATWPDTTMGPACGFDTSYLTMQLYRCQAALWLREPEQAVELALGLCESVTWLMNSRRHVFDKPAISGLSILSSLKETLLTLADRKVIPTAPGISNALLFARELIERLQTTGEIARVSFPGDVLLGGNIPPN